MSHLNIACIQSWEFPLSSFYDQWVDASSPNNVLHSRRRKEKEKERENTMQCDQSTKLIHVERHTCWCSEWKCWSVGGWTFIAWNGGVFTWKICLFTLSWYSLLAVSRGCHPWCFFMNQGRWVLSCFESIQCFKSQTFFPYSPSIWERMIWQITIWLTIEVCSFIAPSFKVQPEENTEVVDPRFDVMRLFPFTIVCVCHKLKLPRPGGGRNPQSSNFLLFVITIVIEQKSTDNDPKD